MAEPTIQILTEEQAITRIVQTVQQADAAVAPFALVVGSGFSHGLVPTARQIVDESLPLWMDSLDQRKDFEQPSTLPDADRNRVACAFWQGFVRNNPGVAGSLTLNTTTGLPDDCAAAYQVAFDPHYFGAVGAPADARRFQRALMRLETPRLNAAHFLLASLLGVQPGRSRRNDLFKARAAFCRLILTTNFDPFLQIALQAVNRLYFMSDTPELGISDEILDEPSEAIHLLYLHGSIHRRKQAASESDISDLKKKNARTLAPVLKRHGVIVLGYSGWDDAIVEALAACDEFDHRLYWCGRETDPLAKGAFGPRVSEILRKRTAAYVRIHGAGLFMAQLCAKLVTGLPRLLDSPIGQLREMLETINLSELRPVAAPAAPGTAGQQAPSPDALAAKHRETIERLVRAEKSFREPLMAAGPEAGEAPQAAPVQPVQAPLPDAAAQAIGLIASARAASALGNGEESLRHYKQALDAGHLAADVEAEALLSRSVALYEAGKIDEAVRDWTRIIELPGATEEQVAWALHNRGLALGKQGETGRALADFNRLIEQQPGVSEEVLAQALGNRGWLQYLRGDYEAFLRDTQEAVNMLHGAPTPGLFNLGLALLACGRDEDALEAYAAGIVVAPDFIESEGLHDLADAQKTWLSAERAAAPVKLLNRGLEEQSSEVGVIRLGAPQRPKDGLDQAEKPSGTEDRASRKKGRRKGGRGAGDASAPRP